jgi:hypothetical protein
MTAVDRRIKSDARARARRAWGVGVLVACVVLVGAPATLAAGAAGEPGSQAAVSAGTLPAPALTDATIKGDNVALFWTPGAGDTAAQYGIYANGRFLYRTFGPERRTLVFLASLGLTGRETFTVVAEDSSLNGSAPSNGLVPVAPDPLPAPELRSAVREGDSITLTWTPSQTKEVFAPVQYDIKADGRGILFSVTSTTVTFPLTDPHCTYFLSGSEEFTVVARDRSLAESPPSNGLVATSG